MAQSGAWGWPSRLGYTCDTIYYEKADKDWIDKDWERTRFRYLNEEIWYHGIYPRGYALLDYIPYDLTLL